jgi:mRNA interferase MazF
MAGMTFPLRGEVYWVRLDPTVGTEMQKTRPGVIVSNDIGNELSARVIIAPVTSQGTQRVFPFEVLAHAGEAGLTEAGKIAIDQIRSVDKLRLGRRIGMLPQERIVEVDKAIRVTLSV